MKRLFLIAAATLALSSPASAYNSVTCVVGYGVAICAPAALNEPAGIQRVPLHVDMDADGETETRAQWTARCNPRTITGKHGMQHIVHDQKGCEFGPQ